MKYLPVCLVAPLTSRRDGCSTAWFQTGTPEARKVFQDLTNFLIGLPDLRRSITKDVQQFVNNAPFSGSGYLGWVEYGCIIIVISIQALYYDLRLCK